ncbi:hypothetical protein FB45DRAFT_1130625 [Roridomyces roridus]|uniref:Uncharacterized protein n=1 Tax=Roridomyces roridus TaxID=1738132 RepID=A0AAD7B2K0_9AGAR|nr:hypothetical protein FB45DRAFT_1130625 [Roridomyces roridus]
MPLKLVPILPEDFQRYKRQRKIIKRRTQSIIPELSRSFDRAALPQWSPRGHPEGALYFAHDKWRIYTDAYLYDTLILDQINCAVEQIVCMKGVQDLMNTHPRSVDLVLDLRTEGPGNAHCGYYFADHASQVIFWLHPFDMKRLNDWKMVPGIQEGSHIKLCLEVEYWLHCEYFPVTFQASVSMLQEFRDTIVYGIGDAMTSSKTTQLYPMDHLFQMLSLSKEFVFDTVGTSSELRMRSGSIVVLARFMKEFARQRFYNFHNEKTPRLNQDESVYESTGPDPQRNSLFSCFAFLLLFNIPERHLRTLQVVNMDHIINYASWQKFITARRSDWGDLVLYGTIILNANVAFLAVPGGNSAAGRVASYASICVGLGSIVVGIRLLRKYQLPDIPDVEKALKFFNYASPPFGLRFLSIYLSLPDALMIWSYVLSAGFVILNPVSNSDFHVNFSIIDFILAFLITVYETDSIPVRAAIFAILLPVVCLAVGGTFLIEQAFRVWLSFLGWIERNWRKGVRAHLP